MRLQYGAVYKRFATFTSPAWPPLTSLQLGEKNGVGDTGGS